MFDLSKFSITPENWEEVHEEFFLELEEKAPSPTLRRALLKKAAMLAGKTLEEVENAWRQFKEARGEKDGGKSKNGGDTSVANLLFDIIYGDTELWMSDSGEPFASIYLPNGNTGEEPDEDGGVKAALLRRDVPKHLEHHPIRRGGVVEDWVRDKYYRMTYRPLSETALNDILEHLKAEARLSGKVYRVYNRIGWYKDRVYLDLARPDGLVVEITERGFKVIHMEAAPVKFRRSPSQRPLPIPKSSEDGLFRILNLVNLVDERDKANILGWLVGVFLPEGPYPALILEGEKGAGKSTLARILKELIDPTEAPLLFEPRNVEDLMVATQNNHILTFDNLSRIPPWLSDALARLSTGAGMSKRRLYTDAEEKVIKAARPVILTGIDFGELRDDLADRSILMKLYRISDSARRTDWELEDAFQTWWAEALGQSIGAVSYALRNRAAARERLTSLPRMSTWAVWAEAAGPAFGLEPGAIVSAFQDTQTALNKKQLDLDSVAQAVLALYEEFKPGQAKEYTTRELLQELERVYFAESDEKRPRDWPRTPQGLGKRLPRLAEALRTAGVHINPRKDPRTKNNVWLIAKPNPDEVKEETPTPKPAETPKPAAPEKPATPDKPAAAPKPAAPDKPTAPGSLEKEHLEESAGPTATSLFKNAPPEKGKKERRGASSKPKEDPKKEWMEVYGGKGLYPDLIKFNPSDAAKRPEALDPAELEGLVWVDVDPPDAAKF